MKNIKQSTLNWVIVLVIAIIFSGAIYIASEGNPLFSQAGFRDGVHNGGDRQLYSILGDGGMVDAGAHLMLYTPTTARHADCINGAATGPGPNGNLITAADNARTDWPDSELNLANKCFSLVPGSSSLGWYHWGVVLGNAGNPNQRTSVTHQWSDKTTDNTYFTGFSGEWTAPAGQTKSTYATTLSTERIGDQLRRTLGSTITSGTTDYNTLYMAAPSATDYRQILYNKWLEGNDVVFRAWVRLAETVPADSVNRYRFAAPEVEGCWKVDGSACVGAATTNAANVTRFFSIDINPHRVDQCRDESLTHCPPFHITEDGVKIAKTDKEHFPYSAYYYWCGPSQDATITAAEKCPNYGQGGQEIVQLSPSSIWARYGAPAQPIALGRDTYLNMNIGAMADRFYKGQRVYPQTLRFNTIYIAPELFAPNVTVNWKVAGFDVLKPAAGSTTGGGTTTGGGASGDGHTGGGTQDIIAPQVSNVRIEVSGTQATVRWTTNEDTDSTVQYLNLANPTKSALQTKSDPQRVREHIVTITNLTPNSKYIYRVISKDAAGNPGRSTPTTFTTAR